MRSPATCSSTRNGCSCSVNPASSSRAMLGCPSRASTVPSRRNRSAPAASNRARFRSLTAAEPSKRPSLRWANHTVPMPPEPRARSSVHVPSLRPASVGTAWRAARPSNRNCLASSSGSAASSRSSSSACRGRSRRTSASHASRSSGARSSAWSSSPCRAARRSAGIRVMRGFVVERRREVGGRTEHTARIGGRPAPDTTPRTSGADPAKRGRPPRRPSHPSAGSPCDSMPAAA